MILLIITHEYLQVIPSITIINHCNLPFREANANDIAVLADDVIVSYNDGMLTKAFVWLTIDGHTVCIDVVNCKVRVGDYVPFELEYNRNDDAIGLYNELVTVDYS